MQMYASQGLNCIIKFYFDSDAIYLFNNKLDRTHVVFLPQGKSEAPSFLLGAIIKETYAVITRAAKYNYLNSFFWTTLLPFWREMRNLRVE